MTLGEILDGRAANRQRLEGDRADCVAPISGATFARKLLLRLLVEYIWNVWHVAQDPCFQFGAAGGLQT